METHTPECACWACIATRIGRERDAEIKQLREDNARLSRIIDSFVVTRDRVSIQMPPGGMPCQVCGSRPSEFMNVTPIVFEARCPEHKP